MGGAWLGVAPVGSSAALCANRPRCGWHKHEIVLQPVVGLGIDGGAKGLRCIRLGGFG